MSRRHNLLFKIGISLLLALGAATCGLFVAGAQGTQSLSVSPALFEVSVAPMQQWQSSLRIVNGNPYDLTVYVEPVNFAPKGEGGDGTLLPVDSGFESGATVAEWLVVSRDPVVIPAEQSVDIPYTLSVPADASPGGHFAAFTVSTRPPDSAAATVLRTAQVVTSLFFVRVAGEVTERGDIREFRAADWLLGAPEATFILRFQNDGTVHLRPQGDITITNMWGQERGVVPINRQSHFGNVLPSSTRQFTFSWRGDWSLSDIGRYEAVVTLAYGTDARQFVSRKTYFWVIPTTPLLLVLGGFVLFLGLTTWLVRLYVRRLLSGAGVSHYHQPVTQIRYRATSPQELRLDQTTPRFATDSEPPAPRRIAGSVNRLIGWCLSWGMHFVSKVYARSGRVSRRVWVIGATLTVFLLATFLIWFIRGALTPQRSYEVFYDDRDPTVSVSSDTIIFENSATSMVPPPRDHVATTTPITLVNESGVAGVAAALAEQLVAKGFDVESLQTALGETRTRTTIVYAPEAQDVALALSAHLGGVPLSAFVAPEPTDTPVVVYLGEDGTAWIP
jgi:LytR cell envelope-related transcriptional attenuator